MTKKIIIADKSYSEKLEKLRGISYHNSKGFSVNNEEEFQKYCRWSFKDEIGIVLLALNEDNEAISSLRSIVYFDKESHIANNKVFQDCADGFVSYPTLDMTFATTHPDYYGGGLMSVLRYFMYVLHKHSVKSITGHVVKNSILHTQLKNLGYEFLETDYNRQDIKTVENWMLAVLTTENVDKTIQTLKAKYASAIHEYPLVVG